MPADLAESIMTGVTDVISDCMLVALIVDTLLQTVIAVALATARPVCVDAGNPCSDVRVANAPVMIGH